jgi:hypothetical protein
MEPSGSPAAKDFHAPHWTACQLPLTGECLGCPVTMKEWRTGTLAAFGAAWVAVWLHVLLTRTEASLVVRVGGGAYLAAGLAMLVFVASGRHEPRRLDWAISVSLALGVCGAALYVSPTKAGGDPTAAGHGLFGAWGCLLVPFCLSTGPTRGVGRR